MSNITYNNDGSLRAPYGTIGNAIRKLRQDRQWTQEQLGKRIKRTQSAIAAYECGRVCPSTPAAMLMAIEFNVPLEFILAHRKTLFAK